MKNNRKKGNERNSNCVKTVTGSQRVKANIGITSSKDTLYYLTKNNKIERIPRQRAEAELCGLYNKSPIATPMTWKIGSKENSQYCTSQNRLQLKPQCLNGDDNNSGDSISDVGEIDIDVNNCQSNILMSCQNHLMKVKVILEIIMKDYQLIQRHQEQLINISSISNDSIILNQDVCLFVDKEINFLKNKNNIDDDKLYVESDTELQLQKLQQTFEQIEKQMKMRMKRKKWIEKMIKQ